jgi:hypothetical protein
MIFFLISSFVIGWLFLMLFRAKERSIVLEVSNHFLYGVVRVLIGSVVIGGTYFLAFNL